MPIELTESATIANMQINTIVDDMRNAGFVLQMDDFGSGYSSLSGLCRLKFEALKLDKSIIDGIGSPREDEMLRHVVSLAHFFGMEVVAEGVETDAQYNFLKKLSCDTIQGYLFSKPLPPEDFRELITSRTDDVAEMIDEEALADQASVGSLRITNEEKIKYLSSLASVYMTIHVIDLKEDTVIEFATTTNVKEHANRAHNAAAQMKGAMTATVSEEYLDSVLKFTDINTIRERLKGKRQLSMDFVGKHFGKTRAAFVTVSTDENDFPEKIIFTTQVIEQDRKNDTETLSECITDELTGVFNKTAYDTDCSAGRWSEEKSPHLAVVFADINGLKAINDKNGRAAGDEALDGIAQCLNSVFGKCGRVYRIIDDKFAAVITSAADTEEMKTEFENALRNWMGNEVRNLSVSYGVASRDMEPAKDFDSLLKKADKLRLEFKAALNAQNEGDSKND